MAKLANAYRYRWFASAVHAANTDVKAIKRGRDQVRAELARRFPDADLDWSLEQDPNGPPWVVAGQRYPGLAEATRRFTKYGGIHGVPGLYDLLSLIVHPNLHTALASILQAVQHDGFIQYNYRVDLKQTIRLLLLAAAFLYRAGMVVCSFFQLDPTVLKPGPTTHSPPTAATARSTCVT